MLDYLLGLTALGLLALTGCGPDGDLFADPGSLEFGTIDFSEDVPDGGFASTLLTLRNASEDTLEATLIDMDTDRLCSPGFETGTGTSGEIAHGAGFSMYIGVCAYVAEDGDRCTEMTGALVFETTGSEGVVEVPWSFTPVLGPDDCQG